MIIEDRNDGLRLFAQHEHALLSGELAHAWRGWDEDEPEHLPMSMVMAVAMHDFAWHGPDDWDETPPAFDIETGRAHNFITLPAEDRVRIYREGLDALAPIHPYVAYLVSRHYSSFLRPGLASSFLAREAERQNRLRAVLAMDETVATRHFRLLQFFDLLSLYMCMAGPEARPESIPVWLRPQMKAADKAVTVSWRDASTLVVEPFPFVGPVQFPMGYRALPERHYPDLESFLVARSSRQTLEFEVVPERTA